MDFYALFQWLENSDVGAWMRDSVYALPFINALHVVSVVVLFGSLITVDLRLIGVLARTRTFTRVSQELLRFTWVGFAGALISGLLMLTANATEFYVNKIFWFKMGTIVLAGLNMMFFELRTMKTVSHWDATCPPPDRARLAGVLSISLWTAVIFLGRWIGYTKGFDFDAPIDIDLDNLMFSMLAAGGFGAA
ncbi:DUF6644 family protein [Pseudoroseicyclus tamaricis]|uniref:DUF6644 domain-containing protein n=1 Tax=Pseudoroseicyclus tamaricis TaxID=2705421 RepID=A0A6B2JMK2_9RHOB|nr:DUF6644 family protein [Pseudoroseicyclus tamaricis]NDV02823.1 hypothetical protein [Pseudoroseicyclus tamaricis]